jgi:hypothetical protein
LVLAPATGAPGRAIVQGVMSARRSNLLLLVGLLMAGPLTGMYVGGNFVSQCHGDSPAEPGAA